MFWAYQFLLTWFQSRADAVFLIWKETRSLVTKYLTQLQLQVASVLDSFLNRVAEVRAWLSRTLAGP